MGRQKSRGSRYSSEQGDLLEVSIGRLPGRLPTDLSVAGAWRRARHSMAQMWPSCSTGRGAHVGAAASRESSRAVPTRHRRSPGRRPGTFMARTHEKLSLIHISEPTRLLSISYAVFCLKKKKK